MANIMTLTPYDGYPTENAMRVWVEFEVTYAGTYYSYFELYDENDDIIQTSKGSSYNMDAGEVASNIYKTFTGLDPGTDYYIVGSLWNADTGKRLIITEPIVYFTTEGEEEEEFINAMSLSPASGYPTDTAMRVWVEFEVAEAGQYYPYFQVYKAEGSVLETTAQGSTYNMDAGEVAGNIYKTITGLTSDTDYYIVGTIVNAETGKTIIGVREVLYFTTEALKPKIRVADFTAGATSVTLSADVEAPKGEYYVVLEIGYLDNWKQTHTTNRFTTSVGLSWTFTDIPSGTDVIGYVYLYDYITDELYDDDFSDVTTLIPVRPSNWSWTSTVASGAEIPYTQSGNTVRCKPLTASEWNGFIDRVFAFMDYLEISYSGDISSLYVTKGDEMLSEDVNNVRTIISVMDPPTSLPDAVSIDGKIRASFINGLKNSLNSIE